MLARFARSGSQSHPPLKKIPDSPMDTAQKVVHTKRTFFLVHFRIDVQQSGEYEIVDESAFFQHLFHFRITRVLRLLNDTTNPTSGAARGGRGKLPPLWVDVQKLCNMCVLSLSWNFFVSHDKYIARPSSKEPR